MLARSLPRLATRSAIAARAPTLAPAARLLRTSAPALAEGDAPGAAGGLTLNFTVPSGSLYESAAVEMVILPGGDGQFGVMPSHVPTITELKPGVVSVQEEAGGPLIKYFVSGGFASGAHLRAQRWSSEGLAPLRTVATSTCRCDKWGLRSEVRSASASAPAPLPTRTRRRLHRFGWLVEQCNRFQLGAEGDGFEAYNAAGSVGGDEGGLVGMKSFKPGARGRPVPSLFTLQFRASSGRARPYATRWREPYGTFFQSTQTLPPAWITEIIFKLTKTSNVPASGVYSCTVRGTIASPPAHPNSSHPSG